jgi:hypothetical protein
LSFPNQLSIKALRLGVAAAAVADAELGELRLEASRGEGGAVVASEGELARLDAVGRGRLLDDRDRLVGAAAQLELPGDDPACAAVDDRDQVRPAVLGDPDRGRVELPQLPGAARPAKKPGRLRRSSGRRRWISLRSRITRSTRFRFTARPRRCLTNAVTIR